MTQPPNDPHRYVLPKDKPTSLLYRILRWLIWLFAPKMQLEGAGHLPSEPAIIVANHAQMYGPLAAELHFPGSHYIWCAGQMMHLKEVPDYAYQDFWSGKPKYIRWFFRLLSYLIAPLAVCLFNNAHTVPVYHDFRVVSSLKATVGHLQAGAHVIIFPEHYQPHNNIVHDFQDKFIDTARLYYKRTGKALCFVPMYVAPALKKMVLGAPVRFDPDAVMDDERRRICNAMMDAITDAAAALPPHTVVPYPNLPKKQYPQSLPIEVYHP